MYLLEIQNMRSQHEHIPKNNSKLRIADYSNHSQGFLQSSRSNTLVDFQSAHGCGFFVLFNRCVIWVKYQKLILNKHSKDKSITLKIIASTFHILFYWSAYFSFAKYFYNAVKSHFFVHCLLFAHVSSIQFIKHVLNM